MSNAFAPIVRARPNPIFGRPVHQGFSPYRLQPDTSPQTLRIPDRSRHPVLRRESRRPPGHYPRLWIQRPSSERRRDFNPPDSCAAQRTLWAVLSFGSLSNLAAHRPDLGAVGERKVQVLARTQAAIPTLAGAHRTPSASAVCSLESALWTRPNNGSRMMREYHVRF